jgi:hypothetical protein
MSRRTIAAIAVPAIALGVGITAYAMAWPRLTAGTEVLTVSEDKYATYVPSGVDSMASHKIETEIVPGDGSKRRSRVNTQWTVLDDNYGPIWSGERWVRCKDHEGFSTRTVFRRRNLAVIH